MVTVDDELGALRAPYRLAMSISGHRTISTFLRYAIASEEDKQEALRKVEARVAAEWSGSANTDPTRTMGGRKRGGVG